MIPADTWTRVLDHFSIFPVDVRARLFIPVSPSSQAGDFVIFFPLCEGVVCGMVEYHSSTVSDIVHECFLCGGGPVVAVIVEYDQLVG